MTHPLTPREKVEPSLSDLLRQAVDTMKSWTPEQREAHFEAQKKAWVAAEMAFGDEGTRVVTALASGSGDHAELARLAERCTSGDPWYKDGDLRGRQSFGQFLSQDRAFIAAASPATVLALLAENAALRAERTFQIEQKEGAEDALFDGMSRATEAERALSEHRIAADLLVSSLKSDLAEAERKLAEAVGLLHDLLPETPVTLRPDGGWVQKWDHDEVSPTHWLPLPPAPGAEA